MASVTTTIGFDRYPSEITKAATYNEQPRIKRGTREKSSLFTALVLRESGENKNLERQKPKLTSVTTTIVSDRQYPKIHELISNG